MNEKQVINRTIAYVKKQAGQEATGHDWWHAFRVLKLAEKISKIEGGDSFIIKLAALLHDLADWKLNQGSSKIGLKKVKNFLSSQKLGEDIVEQIIFIIKHISFSSPQPKVKSIELKIAQDADRLDSIGAMGIARTFAYGGNRGRLIYQPNIKPTKIKNYSQYKKNKSHSINHFYEKLLKVKSLMNTKTGEKLAIARHEFLIKFLEQFFKEWNLKV